MKKDLNLLKASVIVYLLLGLTNGALGKNEIDIGKFQDLLRLLSYICLVLIALSLFRYFKEKASK